MQVFTTYFGSHVFFNQEMSFTGFAVSMYCKCNCIMHGIIKRKYYSEHIVIIKLYPGQLKHGMIVNSCLSHSITFVLFCKYLYIHMTKINISSLERTAYEDEDIKISHLLRCIM